MDDDNGKADEHWHVTRGIPVAFMVSMLIYFVSNIALAAWFVSSMTSRVEQGERAQAQLQVQVAPLGERLTRVEEKLVAASSGISDIKSILQQSANRPSR